MADVVRIALVDDEEDIREMLEEYLTGQGFECKVARDAKEGRALLVEWAPNLMILDITMPGEDGLSLARHVRERYPQVGIAMLTASAEVVSRIVGLEVGADDYVTKPCDLRELLARIKSVLRRMTPVEAAPEAPLPTPTDSEQAALPNLLNQNLQNQVRFGRCVLDVESHSLFADDGEVVPLTSMEYDLLKAFADHPNRVLSRDQLLDLAHNRDWEPFDRSIDIRISRLRRKIELDPAKPQVIKTLRGAGYMYIPRAHD